jgi:alpha-glucoside transport system permease protein
VDRIVGTVTAVVVAIGASALIFVGANKLFDLVPNRWRLFSAGVGAGLGATTFFVLYANELIALPGLWIAAGGLVGGLVGYLMGGSTDWTQRLAAGAGGGALLGLFAGIALKETTDVTHRGSVVGTSQNYPMLDPVNIVVWVLIGFAAGYLFWMLRGRRTPVERHLVLFGTIGWIFGAILVSDVGGSQAEAIIALAIAGMGLGARFGVTTLPDASERDRVSSKSRIYIFLTPALFFIFMTLVAPTIRTLYLSFFDVGLSSRQGADFVGFGNYTEIFGDATIIDASNWTDMFTSALFWWGLGLLALGLGVGLVLGRRRSHRFEASGGSLIPGSIGISLLVFAVFTTIRGTIANNLWWVFVVTVLATGLGLAIAVLADRAKGESFAKSLIFLPMALSFVGAGIIWRFMYIARDISKDQTGVFNALWVELGKLSNNDTAVTIIVAALVVIAGGLVFLAMRGRRADATGIIYGSLMLLLPVGWLIYRFLGPGLGGFIIEDGEVLPDTIFFLQQSPFNNIWLMVVLIWIQVGFSMVIFSAAIKAVPGELIEAAKVDGASEAQTFFRVIVPQIANTFGVVVTTLVVLVMKVFDIVKVMTNGNFDTQVLANEMWQRAFTELRIGLGSALAVLLFLSVLPIMYINIRRMQKATV